MRSDGPGPFGGEDLAHGGLGASLPLGDDRLGESEVVVRDDPLVQRIGVLVDVPHAHSYAPIALSFVVFRCLDHTTTADISPIIGLSRTISA